MSYDLQLNMGKRKPASQNYAKRAKLSRDLLDNEDDEIIAFDLRSRNDIKRDEDQLQTTHADVNTRPVTQIANYEIQQRDKVQSRVDIIVQDIESNSNQSLTIWGTSLSIEKTIAVVEELKRNFTKNKTSFSQSTAIKSDDNNVPHLQVVLTLNCDQQ